MSPGADRERRPEPDSREEILPPPLSADQLDRFLQILVGQPVSHAWRGAGGAALLELGRLTQNPPGPRGHPSQPTGQASIGLEDEWRIEEQHTVQASSDRDDDEIDGVLKQLVGLRIEQCRVEGRAPDLFIALSNGWQIRSFAIRDAEPTWWILFSGDLDVSVHVEGGAVRCFSQSDHP